MPVLRKSNHRKSLQQDETSFYSLDHRTKTVKTKKWLLLPLFGCMLFVALYIVATLCYPGGSPFNKQTTGFSWAQNYWCNLLNETALNGQVNSARPVALTATVVLCTSLVGFWYLFPLQAGFSKGGRRLMQVSALLSMITVLFLFTSYHDMVINVATGFGAIALGGTFVGLRKLRWKGLFWTGLVALPLIALNNLLYYNKSLQIYLPVVQKITFLYFLVWISSISLCLYRRSQTTDA